MSDVITTAQDVADKVAEATENVILKQINWLVSRGLLVVKKGELRLVQEKNSSEITIQQDIELVVSGHEYIEKLEAEIRDLRAREGIKR